MSDDINSNITKPKFIIYEICIKSQWRHYCPSIYFKD